jgi:hypothetical protein
MAPNLIEVNLKRLKLTNENFEDLVKDFEHVKVLDISDCQLIEEAGVLKYLENCGKIVTRFEARNCSLAITNNVVKAIANLENTTLTYLDISLSKLITDEGLQYFEGKTLPIEYLNIHGLSAVTGAGLYHPIYAVRNSI